MKRVMALGLCGWLTFVDGGCGGDQQLRNDASGAPFDSGGASSFDALPSIGSCDEEQNLTVSNADDLATAKLALSEMMFSLFGDYVNAQLPVSPTYLWVDSTDLAITDLSVPQQCGDSVECEQYFGFWISQPIDGVTCLQEDPMVWFDFQLCDRIRIDANTRVRFRNLIIDVHPSKLNFVPAVQLLPPCAESCPGEARCPQTGECWNGFDSYCRLCAGKPADRCACQTSEGYLPDGQNCDFFISGDSVLGGTCQNGVCETTNKPARNLFDTWLGHTSP